LANKIITLTASGSGKEFLSYEKAYGRPFDDMMRRVPSLQRIKETIGFSPTFGLNQTLDLIIGQMK
jgi:UDP-glucose 4-epimerase